MEKTKTKRTTIMPGGSEAGVEVKIEVKEEFHLDKYDVHKPEKGSQFYEVMLPVNTDMCQPLRCRLCAIPNSDMIDMFSCYQTEANIVEKIKYCLRIVVRSNFWYHLVQLYYTLKIFQLLFVESGQGDGHSTKTSVSFLL